MGLLSLPHLLVVSVIVLLLFGNRVPQVMRSLGEGLGEFNKGLKSLGNSVDFDNKDHKRLD